MKQGSFKAVRLIVFLLVMLSLAVFSVIADDKTVDFESIILEPFDGESSHHWSFGGKDYNFDFEWRADASKFSSRIDDVQYPQVAYIPAWPMALFGTNRDNKDLKSLGIWGKFDRRGYNWVDIYPVKIGAPENDGEDPETFEIPVPGRIQIGRAHV